LSALLNFLVLCYYGPLVQPVTKLPVADNAVRRHLRSAARGDLAVPVTRTVRYGPRSFAVAGPSTWNSLPVSLRSCHLPSSFRRDLKTELFISMPIISTLVTVYNVRAGEHNSSTHHHHHPTRFRHQCVRQAATYRVVSMKLGDREDSV